ncbi:MAG: NRDE family protein [Azospirillaceae bacterium]
MCSVVILRRPDHSWPVVIAANRDEMADRPAAPPDRHWPDRPEIVAGLDRLSGGSWLGLNDAGVVAAVLNRAGTLGPADGKRSRGELVLEALEHADAVDAASALAELESRAWRPFNLLVADDRDAYWIAAPDADDPRPDRPVRVRPVPEGVSMLTAHDLNDRSSPRIARYLPKFEAAVPPDPDTGDWAAWEALLAETGAEPGAGPLGGLAVVTDTGYGTVSSSLIALPDTGLAERKPVWRFAAGRPGTAPFTPVTLG